MPSDREEAIAAGLLVGDCAYCGESIWRDRDPDFVSAGTDDWHRSCAETLSDLLDSALS